MNAVFVKSAAGLLRLRAEHDDDEAFRYRLFCESRTPEWERLRANPTLFEQLMQHQFQAQTAGYRSQFPKARFDIIELEEQPIGRVVVDRPDTMVHIVDLAIVPSLRNRGIGATIMQNFLDEARSAHIPARFYVASNNDPSLRLYLRLGFTPIQTTPSYMELEWRDAAP